MGRGEQGRREGSCELKKMQNKCLKMKIKSCMCRITVNFSEKGSHRDRKRYDKNFYFMPCGGLRARRLVGPGRARGRADSYMCVSERACDYVRGSGKSRGYSKLTCGVCQLKGSVVVFNGLEHNRELLSRRLLGGWKRQGNYNEGNANTFSLFLSVCLVLSLCLAGVGG